MKLPVVMEIYQELMGRGILDGDRPPRNVLELTNLLERAKVSFPKVSPGKIYLYDVDHAEPSEIRSFLDSGSVKYVGAMGTSAKMMAEREKICLDFTFGVIDKSILKATTGQSSQIMTSGGMVEHAIHRIGAYCDLWGGEDSDICSKCNCFQRSWKIISLINWEGSIAPVLKTLLLSYYIISHSVICKSVLDK